MQQNNMNQTLEAKVKKLRGLPLQLKTGIDAGAEKTVHEWAEEFGVEDGDIRRALTTLRQKHSFHQYHPIGTKRGLHGQQGTIVDINTKKEYITETMGQQKTIFLDPQIVAFSSWLETGYQKYPELRQAFKAYLSDEIAKLIVLDEELKALPAKSK